MSDHPREAERNLKRIYICDDVWYNVFDWTLRADLGLKIAPISARFDGLVDRHLRGVRRWTIGHIEFGRSVENNRAVVWKGGNVDNAVLLEESALLDVTPPSNLIGFQKIEICYFNQDVIAFLHRICHLFNTVDITFMLPSCSTVHRSRQIATHLWPLIAHRLYKLISFDKNIVFALRQLIAPTVLRDCTNLRVIHSKFVFPEMPADDGATASDGQAMAMWLHTPRSDGRPKVLTCTEEKEKIANKLDGLKMAFVNAESPVNYIILVSIGIFAPNVESFEFVNELTRERMKFEKTTEPDLFDYKYWLLKRGLILWGKSDWAESERHAKASVADLSEEMNLLCCDKIVAFDYDFVV